MPRPLKGEKIAFSTHYKFKTTTPKWNKQLPIRIKELMWKNTRINLYDLGPNDGFQIGH